MITHLLKKASSSSIGWQPIASKNTSSEYMTKSSATSVGWKSGSAKRTLLAKNDTDLVGWIEIAFAPLAAIFAGGIHTATYAAVDIRNSEGSGSIGDNLSQARSQLSGASAGNNAVFAGGTLGNGVVDYRTASGTGGVGTDLYTTTVVKGAAASAGDNAIFGGGSIADTGGSGALTMYSIVRYRNSTGTGGNGTSLSSARRQLAAASAEDRAIFAAGNSAYTMNVTYTIVANVDIRNSTGTGSSGTALSKARDFLTAATAGSNAIFGGGATDRGSSNGATSAVDYRTSSGTGSEGTVLSSATAFAGAASAEDRAIFGGGEVNYSTTRKVNYRNADGTGSEGVAFTSVSKNMGASTAGNNAVFAGGGTTSAGINSVEYRNSAGTGAVGQVLSQARYSLAAASAGN